MLSLAYWVLGQGLGGMFAGGATDPNAGLLFVVLAWALYPLVGIEAPVPRASRRGAADATTTVPNAAI